jgi:23S rRNA (pseudouridine1915-N3)-methyltransferase
VRIVVVAVGKLRPPFADDVQHYRKLLAGHTRLELVEVREDDQVVRRVPERSFVSLLHRDGERPDSLAFARVVEDRRQGGRDLCFIIGGPIGARVVHVDPAVADSALLGLVVLPRAAPRARIAAREPYHY